MTPPVAAPTLPRQGAASVDQLVRLLSYRLEQSQIAAIWIPAVVAPGEVVFSRIPLPHRTAWMTADGTTTIGGGVTLEVRGHGAERFEQVRSHIASAYASLTIDAVEGAAPLDPRFYGGFAFHPGEAQETPWSSLGDARFVLPRLVYRHHSQRAQVGLVVSRETANAPSLVRQVGELLAWRDTLHSPAAPTGMPRPPPPTRGTCSPELHQRLEAAVAATETGALDKVVVADRQIVSCDRAPDPAQILGRLVDESPTAAIFAIDDTNCCFLGASPERLVRREGLQVTSEALAGSIRLAPDLDADRLLVSAKDRSEHAFVVRAIRAALDPVCSSVTSPSAPVLRTLRRVAHLSTPVEARLRTNLHVLDLVQRLHPTPAVAGSPTAAALAWIRNHEPHARGWYASPVGWVDARGDGDFCVALRSGVLSGMQATFFAGAGIVRGSTPDTEAQEIDLKLSTFRGALGVAGQ